MISAYSRSLLLTGLLLLMGIVVNAQPAPLGANQVSTSLALIGKLPDGCKTVADPAAKGGQAIELAFAKAGDIPAILFTKGITLAGRGVINVPVRGKDLNDVANGLKLKATLINRTTARTYTAFGGVYGVRVSENTYRTLPIYFDVDDTPGQYEVYLAPIWQEQNGDRKPVVWIGGADLLTHGAAAPYISGILRGKLIYAPGLKITMTVTVINPTAAAYQGKLAATECVGVSGQINAATVPVSLAAGETKKFDLSWTAAKPEAGREFQFALLDAAGKELDRDDRSVGIAKDGSLLMFPLHDFVSGEIYVMGGGADPLRSRTAAYSRGRCDIFSWWWGDAAGEVPPEDPFLGGEGVMWRSLKDLKKTVAQTKALGTNVVSYVALLATAEPGYELYQQHPDWFLYEKSGEVGVYQMENLFKRTRRHEFEYLPTSGSFMATLDPTRPEVRRWIADQFIHLNKDMGWDGVRFDVWDLTVKPGQYRLDGTEIAPTWEKSDQLSAESLRAVKDMVNKEVPDFTWGYNYAAMEENQNLPKHFAEKCRGGGWLLDEVEMSYGAKSSPYHFWNAYSKRMIEWGDHVRQLGGIYDPWIFDRLWSKTNPTHIEVDWLYGTIFRLLAGGRCYMDLYKNDDALVGNLPYLAFRFSDVYSGWNLRLQPSDQTVIKVTAPDTLWWKGSVLANRSPEGKEQRIVHLVNSPVVTEVRENRDSKVRPAVTNVTVRCAAVGGRLPQKAYLLTAEPLTPTTEPRVQSVPLPLTKDAGAVTVTVPAVLYLKTVVFEY